MAPPTGGSVLPLPPPYALGSELGREGDVSGEESGVWPSKAACAPPEVSFGRLVDADGGPVEGMDTVEVFYGTGNYAVQYILDLYSYSPGPSAWLH